MSEGGEKPGEGPQATEGQPAAKFDHPAAPAAGTSEKEERMWHMLTHLSALAALIGVPLLNIAGPLIVWQVKKGVMPSIEPHGKEAVNFQISVAIYIAVLMAVGTILVVILVGFLFYFVAGAVAIAALVFTVIAGLKANEGTLYRYPLTIRFIK